MNDILTSWKTSIVGLVLIGLGVHLLSSSSEVGLSLITAGVGLLCAKDADQTGTSAHPRDPLKP